ncbi:DMT family transporter [Aliikangiella sp. G2MR2-5]|uniref:DMT family transporter n=1 Tax=Aliikangiella sp. G2MR2-5 TaxID=2788943 RepID=UPI0018AB9803|nr:DMT family transporter [Aliikangiella sp. G2MR2-5]
MNNKVLLSYISVVLIWSTTPLAIVWSTDSVPPSMAVLLRMTIAIILGLLVIWLKRIAFPWHRKAILLYAYSAMGIFGGMILVYLAARYIASGTISLIFGLAPILSGLLAVKILGDSPFSWIRKLALLVAVLGLGVVFSKNLGVNFSDWPGYLFILFSVFFFCLSGVLVKSVSILISPVATTVGALLLSWPCFLLAWIFMDGTLDYESWSSRAIYAITYLGVMGSFIGFVAYYYILQQLSATTVALLTLMTPVLAILLGVFLNGESFTLHLFIGATLVLSGLLLYHFGERWLNQRKRLD